MRKPVPLISIVILASWIALAMVPVQAAGTEVGRGVVVEEVGEGSALAKAGIESGDVLLSWRRLPSPPANPEGAGGEIKSVFDWKWLELEQAPRGSLEIVGRRRGAARVFMVEPGLQDARVRPWLPDGRLKLYNEGKEYLEARDLPKASRLWKEAAFEAGWSLRCWLLMRIGEAWVGQGDTEKAHFEYDAALNEVEESFPESVIWQAIGEAYEGDNEFELAGQAYNSARVLRGKDSAAGCLASAESLNDLGEVAWARGDLEEAEASYQESLRIRQILAPASLVVAQSLNNVAGVPWKLGDLQKAKEYLLRALELQERLAPNTILVAESLNNLGVIVENIGELDSAWELHQRALRIYQDLEPDSLYVASSLNNLGTLSSDRGDLDRAMNFHRRALEIRELVAPDSLDLALSFNNIGSVSWKRGDLASASDFFRRALEIRQRLAPDSFNVAVSLSNLGVVIESHGDPDRAIILYHRALEIYQEAAPNSLYAASVLNNLGGVARRSGNLTQAEGYYQRALVMRQKMAPEGLIVATVLNNLGSVAFDREDLVQAREFHQHALQIRRRLAPGSLQVSYSLKNLGNVARHGGDLAQAADLYDRALEIQQQLAPDSVEVARTLHALGLLYLSKESPQLAVADELLRRGLEVLEGQIARLGGSHDVRASFRAQHQQLYRDAMRVQLERDQFETSFHTLERSRARSFLEHLAERDPVFTADISEELDRQRRQVAAQVDRTQQELARLTLHDGAEEIEKLVEKMSKFRSEAGDIEEKIRHTSPRLAALHYPRPLKLADARAAIDPGTLVLSYSVGEDSTTLFTVSKESELRVETLDVTREQLRNQVLELDRQIGMARSAGSQRMRRFEEISQGLYSTLIRPVEESVEVSQRLLILGDGPLHYLPWAALIRDTAVGSQYFVEWKPIHLALSATVFAELRKGRRKESQRPVAIRIAAFGDPSYPHTKDEENRYADPVVRSAADRCSFDFASLPYSRLEIESLARSFPAAQVRTYLGTQATEERVKIIGSEVQIIHIAAHGCMDKRFPLNSFVALTIPEQYQEGRDNGLLQAWEVIERVRLDADLVVLSACETALGEERGGEGLYSLTRAFQYAGARTVAASLWRVADRATAELMSRFYRHLRQGESKDEALRAAQIELLRGTFLVPGVYGDDQEVALAAPYFWAAFQIYGDWQ